MRIAILGATSQIARDLISSFAKTNEHELLLFTRSPEKLKSWLGKKGYQSGYQTLTVDKLKTLKGINTIINFVGSGDPARTLALGADILEITLEYDSLVLNYLRKNPNCKYIFLSSGAAFGDIFSEPATETSCAKFPLNSLSSRDWYGVAKAHAECRHRALFDLPIVDLRIYNYFSYQQDMEARFFITDIVRAIKNSEKLTVTSEEMVRDYLNPLDFCNLIRCVLFSDEINLAVDCYSREPIEKMELLSVLKDEFDLQYEMTPIPNSVNATGSKAKYYSTSRKAKILGYEPKFGSRDGVFNELKILFGS